MVTLVSNLRLPGCVKVVKFKNNNDENNDDGFCSILFSDRDNNSIGMCRKGGEECDKQFITGTYGANELAIDSENGKIFWFGENGIYVTEIGHKSARSSSLRNVNLIYWVVLKKMSRK